MGYSRPSGDAVAGAGCGGRRSRAAGHGRPCCRSAEWDTLLNPKFSRMPTSTPIAARSKIELAILDAPLTVANFIALARKGFYNGIAIHRLVPDFVMQHGDPRGDGEGGPGYTIRDEINQRPYLRGTVGMALDWKDTGGSQYFITHSPQPPSTTAIRCSAMSSTAWSSGSGRAVSDVVRRIRSWDGITPQ